MNDHPAVLVLAAFLVQLTTEPRGLGLQLAVEAQTGQLDTALVLSEPGEIKVVGHICIMMARRHTWTASACSILR